MITELERLEERIAQAAEMIQALKEKNRELVERVAQLEGEQKRYAEERSLLAERIARMVDKVDALRLEI